MAQDLTIGIRLTADGSAMVGTVKISREEIDKLTATTKRAGDEAKKFTQTQASLQSQLGGVARQVAAYWAAWQLGSTIKEMALLNARHETLGVVMGVVGRNAGYTATEMEAYAQQVAKAGITMIESRQSVIDLAQAQIGLSNATKLARVAQDAAVIGGVNSSEAFQRIVYGIKSAQVEVLRTVGLNVNFEQSYKNLATQLGKNVNALTEAEKAQARTNAALEAGTLIAGSYEAAMGTAGKQLTSVQRYVEDLKVVLGETFNDALVVAVSAVTEQLKGMTEESRELAQKNELREWGQGIVKVMAVVADAVDIVAYGVRGLIRLSVAAAKSLEFSQKYKNPVDAARNFKEFKSDLNELQNFGSEVIADDNKEFERLGRFQKAADEYLSTANKARTAADEAKKILKGTTSAGYDPRKKQDDLKKIDDLYFSGDLSDKDYRSAVTDLTGRNKPRAEAGGSRSGTEKKSRGENFVEQLQREIEKVGQGEEAYLRLQAAQNGVKDAAEPYIKKLIEARTAQDALIERQKASESATEDYIDALDREVLAQDDAQRAANNYAQSRSEQIDQIRLETSLIGESSIVQRLATEAARLDLEVKKESLKISPEYREKFIKTAAAINGEYLDSLKTAYDASRTFESGVKEALARYREDAGNTAAQTSRVLANGFRAAEDALVNFARTGKLNFKDFANSVINDLLRIQAQQAIASLVGTSKGGGGFLGSIIGAFGSFFGGGGASAGFTGSVSTTSQAYSAGLIGLAQGGAVQGVSGLSALSGSVVSRPTIIPFAAGGILTGEAGPEGVFPLKRGPDGKLGVQAGGGGVNVTNNYYVNAPGAAKGVDEDIRRALKETENNAVQRAIAKVADMNARGQLRLV